MSLREGTAYWMERVRAVYPNLAIREKDPESGLEEPAVKDANDGLAQEQIRNLAALGNLSGDETRPEATQWFQRVLEQALSGK